MSWTGALGGEVGRLDSDGHGQLLTASVGVLGTDWSESEGCTLASVALKDRPS